MLDLIKELLNINDPSKDNILNHYIVTAQSAVKNYLNVDDVSSYEPSIVNLAIFFYNNRKSEGIIQQSQGSRNRTIERGIPQSIKDTLPSPFIRVVG